MAGRPARANNWGLRRRTNAKWLRRRAAASQTKAAIAVQRHSRLSAIGTLVAGIAGALSLLVSAVVAYQGIAAWRSQTAQDRQESKEKHQLQASQVGAWVAWGQTPDEDALVISNRSVHPIYVVNAHFRVGMATEGANGGMTALTLTYKLGAVPPCSQVEITQADISRVTAESFARRSTTGLTGELLELELDQTVVGFLDSKSQPWSIQLGRIDVGAARDALYLLPLPTNALSEGEYVPGFAIDVHHAQERLVQMKTTAVENCGAAG